MDYSQGSYITRVPQEVIDPLGWHGSGRTLLIFTGDWRRWEPAVQGSVSKHRCIASVFVPPDFTVSQTTGCKSADRKKKPLPPAFSSPGNRVSLHLTPHTCCTSLIPTFSVRVATVLVISQRRFPSVRYAICARVTGLKVARHRWRNAVTFESKSDDGGGVLTVCCQPNMIKPHPRSRDKVKRNRVFDC